MWTTSWRHHFRSKTSEQKSESRLKELNRADRRSEVVTAGWRAEEEKWSQLMSWKSLVWFPGHSVCVCVWGEGIKRQRDAQSSLSNHRHSALQQGTFTAGDSSGGAARRPAAAPRSVTWTCVSGWMGKQKTNKLKQKKNICSCPVRSRLLVRNASTADISHVLNNIKHYGYAENIHSDI